MDSEKPNKVGQTHPVLAGGKLVPQKPSNPFKRADPGIMIQIPLKTALAMKFSIMYYFGSTICW